MAQEKLQKNNKNIQKGKIAKIFSDYSITFSSVLIE